MAEPKTHEERVAEWRACQACAQVLDPCDAHPETLFPHGLAFMSRVVEPHHVSETHIKRVANAMAEHSFLGPAMDRERERLARIWSSMSRRDFRGGRKRKEAMRAMRRAAREVLAGSA